MPYNELIKNFAGIRNYMCQFLIYGFRSRDEFDAKSARSYDNEKRRAESWLSDYMSFRQDTNVKSIFLSVDSRHVPENPLYKAWKTSSFTKNDISFHFLILDILAEGEALSISEILERIDTQYIQVFQNPVPIDESTLRKKLKEYVELGLITAKKQGKQLIYLLPEKNINLDVWQDAITFFSEDSPLGVVGSFLMDKFDETQNIFSFKHRYLLFTLDSDIMLGLLTAIDEHRMVELGIIGAKSGKAQRSKVLPLKIYVSVQGGRQYLAAYDVSKKRDCFFRLDSIQKVKAMEIIEGYNFHQECLKDEQPNIWGVSTAKGNIEHIEMTLMVEPKDIHIVRRLEREKRTGTVTRLNEVMWQFSADVYDTMELLPWIRTFIGRIVSLTSSNTTVEKQFWLDLSEVANQYRGDDNAL